MKLVSIAACYLLFGLQGMSCSSGGAADGGLPDSRDGADGDGDGKTVECSREGVFCIVVETGARACGVFQDFRTWSEELALLGRVHFRPGETLLAEDLTEKVAELVDKVEFGPQGRVLEPLGPGLFSRKFFAVADPPDSGFQRYEYLQRFAIDDRELVLRFEAEFWIERGVPERRGILIDEGFPRGRLTGRVNDSQAYTDLQVYDSCDYIHYSLYLITARTGDDVQVIIHKRMYSPGYRAGSMPANIEWAEVSINGTKRVVDDYFSLVYSADHHNWNEGYAVLLRPAVGDVAGVVLLHEGVLADPVEMIYLGADHQELRRIPLVYYKEEEQ